MSNCGCSAGDSASRDDSKSSGQTGDESEETEGLDQAIALPFTAVKFEVITKDEINLSSTSAGSSDDGGQQFVCACVTGNSEDDSEDDDLPYGINYVQLLELKNATESSELSSSTSRITICDCVSQYSSTCKSTLSEDEPEDDKRIENTLAIIKPEAMMFRHEIERVIIDEGFSITQRRWLRLTQEQVSAFYRDSFNRDHFSRLVAYMSSGSVIVFILSKIRAIQEWKLLAGPAKVAAAKIEAPDSIRGKFGRKGDDVKNVVHASANKTDAEWEIHFFFPDFVIEPIIKDEEAVDYLWKHVNKLLIEGVVKCCEEKPSDPVVWLGNWLLDNDDNKPKYLLRRKSNLND